MSRPPTPGGWAQDLGGTLGGTASRIKFLRISSRGGTPALKNVPANGDTRQEGNQGSEDEVEEVDYDIEDILQMAEHLGMDPERDEPFLWIAAEAYDAPVPLPWKEFFDDDGEVYFHNSQTGGVTRDHPLDHYYRILYGIIRQMADKNLDIDVDAARRDAAMALPDQTMQAAIEESKQNVLTMVNNSSTIAKYVTVPTEQSPRTTSAVQDLQVVIRQASDNHAHQEALMSDVLDKMSRLQSGNHSGLSQELLQDLQAQVDELRQSTASQPASADLESAPTSQSSQTDALKAKADEAAAAKNKQLVEAKQATERALADASHKVESLMDDKNRLKVQLSNAEQKLRKLNLDDMVSMPSSLLKTRLYKLHSDARGLKMFVSDMRVALKKSTSETLSVLSNLGSGGNDAISQATKSLVDQASKNFQNVKATADEAESRISNVVAERRRLFNELLRIKGNIRVFCRVRPLNAQEPPVACVEFPNEDRANRQIQLLLEENSQAEAKLRKTFDFDRVFTESASQLEVYQQSVKPLMQSALDGFNVCVFAYGQTGSGKTHTMEGRPSDPGVTSRAINELFELASGECAVPGLIKYTFTLSMLEIYNEQIRDLLGAKMGPNVGSNSKRHDIRMEENGTGVYVTDLVSLDVSSAEEVMSLLKLGSKNRSVGVTKMNEHSSRSHLVMLIRCTSHNLAKQTETTSKISFIDLAGSERVSKSAAEGERLKEAGHINRSLSALGDVISSLALSSNKIRGGQTSHVPFRNSKLTYLLSDSLGNECKTMLFVNISPASLHAQETLCSLMFASRASSVNLNGQQNALVAMKKLREAALQNQALRAEVEKKDSIISELQRMIKQPAPPSAPPPAVSKPMRQHNVNIDINGSAKGERLEEELASLREMNKNLREENAKLQEDSSLKKKKDGVKKSSAHAKVAEKKVKKVRPRPPAAG
mmetsp:Transcript_5060/g.13231  ORF Transcript_5060/g.13231 Transcript_5060/m.13231 type:complete len:938 (+) Transcript_5060:541-3354(+)